MSDVAVLCARRDSHYKAFEGVEVFDADRDAFTFAGGRAVVAHPPCAQWGRLRYFAHVDARGKALAPWCVHQVRRCGGVLEHPATSLLWGVLELPALGQVDRWGGFCIGVRQFDFGHRADKATRLYVVGMRPSEVPAMPFRLGEASHVVATTGLRAGGGRRMRRPALHTREREMTPPAFAAWLIDLARACQV